jgi:hypothetical protein
MRKLIFFVKILTCVAGRLFFEAVKIMAQRQEDVE